MKIGVRAGSLEIEGYGRWGELTYQKLREHGFNCSDFDMCETDSILYTLPHEQSDEFLLREKRLAEEAGIEISQVHGPWRYPPRDFTEEERAERMEKMKRSIRSTAVLGCKNWVIHPIMPFGTDDIKSGDEKKTWDMNLTFMKELLATAKEYDVTICFENMPMLNFSMAKPEAILNFAKEMNDEHFKICLDTGHAAVFTELSLAEETRRLGNYIRVLHVHDNRYSMDAHLFPYFGVINWKEFADALYEIGFNGSFSLETLPPSCMSTPLYEEMCKCLYKIAEEVLRRDS